MTSSYSQYGKPWWRSSTVWWGLLPIAAAIAIAAMDVPLSPGSDVLAQVAHKIFIDHLAELGVSLISAIGVYWGRKRAEGPLV